MVLNNNYIIILFKIYNKLFENFFILGSYNYMKYDVAVIGGGPAGLTAGIFTTHAGLKTICFEKLTIGGQASLSHDIANYPAFESITGIDLTEKMFTHAQNSGVHFEFMGVEKVSKLKTGFSIKTKSATFNAKKLIIASGAKARKLNLINEKEFIGRGVSYCASCDGNFFKGKVVAVVGGGYSACEYVDYLAKLCKHVYLINRSEEFKAGEHRINEIRKHKNLTILTSSQVVELKGREVLEKIKVKNNNATKTLNVEGLFIAIGYEPDLSFLNLKIEKDNLGFIKVDEDQKTSVENVYACGDIVSKKFKQVITACADGARAGNSCIGG